MRWILVRNGNWGSSGAHMGGMVIKGYLFDLRTGLLELNVIEIVILGTDPQTL